MTEPKSEMQKALEVALARNSDMTPLQKEAFTLGHLHGWLCAVEHVEKVYSKLDPQ
jgi:hypothetical protein